MASAFLCHSARDKTFVRRLASDFVARGIRVWLDEAELLPGDKLLPKIAAAIEEMEYLVVVLTPNSVGSPWVQKELEMAMAHELRERTVKVVPIVAAECEIPTFLEGVFYSRMDTKARYRAGLEMLVRRLAPDSPFAAIPEAAGPTGPGFGWVRNSDRRSKLLSPDPDTRQAALEKIRGLSQVVPTALELLADQSEQVVLAAISCLKELPDSEGAWMALSGEDQYLPFGDDAVDGNKLTHYELSVEILCSIYDYLENNRIPRQTLRKLLSVLDSANRTVQAIAIFTLAAVGVEEVISRLIPFVIEEDDELIREIAMWSLAEFAGRLGEDPRVKNALMLGLSDLMGNVRYRALTGIRHFPGGDVTEAVVGLIPDPSGKVAKLALEVLSERDDDTSFAALVSVVSGRRAKVSYFDDLLRAYAVRALASQRRSGIEEVLLALLNDPRYKQAFAREESRAERYVVAEALRALQIHGSPACLTTVEPLMEIVETVNVPAGLQGHGGYWVVEIARTATEIVRVLRARSGKPDLE